MRVPPSARGIPAQSPFWAMSDADQARFRSGWWRAYNGKLMEKGAKHAYKEGWVEAMTLFDFGAKAGPYRFTLSRKLPGSKGIVLFCMLNPSTADDSKDDPTIRRCIGFGARWGYTELRVVNLYAVRSTDPKGLRKVADPIGEGNDDVIRAEAKRADLLVAAWGATGGFVARKRHFMSLHGHHAWQCLGHTSKGHPLHPLYVPYETELVPFQKEGYLCA